MKEKFCAFLRGVNVKGTTMKMAEVVSVFENAGMSDVKSILSSGNVIFTVEKSHEDLRVLLEKAMSEHFSYEAFLFIKTIKDIQNICESNPYEKDENYHTYVFITEKGFENELNTRFDSLSIKQTTEKGSVVNGVFYWQVSKGETLDTEFSKILGQKSLKDKFTTRNLNTIEKIRKNMQ